GHLRRGRIFFSSADKQLVDEMRRRLGSNYNVTLATGYDYVITANGFHPMRPATGKPGYKRPQGGSWIVTVRIPGAKWVYLGKFSDEVTAQQAIDDHELHAFSEEE